MLATVNTTASRAPSDGGGDVDEETVSIGWEQTLISGQSGQAATRKRIAPGCHTGLIFTSHCAMTFLKVLPDEDGRDIAVEEGTGSRLTPVIVSAVALVLENFELKVAAKKNVEKQIWK